MTTEYKWFLARWSRRMCWKEVSETFCVSWDRVYEAVKQAVSWGLEHRDLDEIEAVGVDEVQWHKGHQYQTVVYQLDEGRKRLLWIGRDRKAKTLLRFFRFLGKDRTARLQFICSDMWQAYPKVIAKKAPQAVHVLDRFHIMQRMSKALDKGRAAEVNRIDVRPGAYCHHKVPDRLRPETISVGSPPSVKPPQSATRPQHLPW